MSERSIDLICSALLLGFSLLMLGQLRGVPVEGVLFPQTVLWLLVVCSVLLAGRALLKKGKTLSLFGDIPAARWLAGTALFLAQSLGAMYVSFTLAMSAGMFAMLCMLSPRRDVRALLLNALVTVCFVVFFYVFFTRIMHIYFPEPLFE